MGVKDIAGSLVADAVKKGAKLVAGGKGAGTVVEVTVLDHVTSDMRIYSEESPICAGSPSRTRSSTTRSDPLRGGQAANSFFNRKSGEARSAASGLACRAISISASLMSLATTLPGPMPLAASSRPSGAR